MNNFPPEDLARLFQIRHIDGEIARKPTDCLGKRASNDYTSNCRTCSRLNPDAQTFIVPTWRAGYVHGSGIPWNECDERLPTLHGQNVADLPRKVCDTSTKAETKRYRLRVVLGVLAIAVLSVGISVAVHAAPVCPWPDPGADPFRGDQAAAVMALAEIPLAERIQLADQVRQQYGWRRVMVTRDAADDGRLTELRSMNFGAGRICAGAVDRSMWPPGRHESGRAFAVGRWTVVTFDSCRNVALATDAWAMPAPVPETRESVREGYRGGLGALGVSAAPEPGSLALAGLALAGAVLMGRGRK